MSLHTLLVLAATRLARRDDWDDDDADSNCVKATRGPNGNVPITACNSYYNYDPQFAPTVAVAVIFGIFTAVHIVEAFAFRKVSPDPNPPLPASAVRSVVSTSTEQREIARLC